MLPRTSTTLLIGHLATLWCWGLDSAPAGGPLTAVEIAHGARWTKDADLFVAALQSARLVDRDEDGFWLHDWDDYAGRLVAKRNANTERMRSARAAHVQRTTDARGTHSCLRIEAWGWDTEGAWRNHPSCYVRAGDVWRRPSPSLCPLFRHHDSTSTSQ